MSIAPTRFETFEEARDAFNLALPSFKCPACGNEHLSMIGEFGHNLRTKITLQTNDTPAAEKFVPTIVLICENCGHASTFAEDAIRTLAVKRSKELAGG